MSNPSPADEDVVKAIKVKERKNLFRMLKYDFLFHGETLKVIGVMLDSSDPYCLRQLTSTEKTIANSFGLNTN